MTDDTTAVRVVARGEVQGVFFRASTRELARDHGVAGWARNDAGGSVTAHLEGPRTGVEAVLGWIRAGGPPAARVTDVEVRRTAREEPGGFEVR